MSLPSTNATKTKQQTASLSDQEMQELHSLRREKAALSQILWNLVTIAAPETHVIEISPVPSDPLWQIAFVQSSEPSSGKVRILAGALKPITEQEKKRVVRLLRGTSTPMHEALEQLHLPHPPSYVEKEIEAHLKWKPAVEGDNASFGQWESVKPPTIGEKVKNLVNWPK